MLFRRKPADPVTEPPAPGFAPADETQAPAPPSRKKRRWRIAAAILALFMALIAWLAITAPLSQSLRPIAAPSITLLSADGTPIARRGAVVGEPISAADLPAHVTGAFLAIEDRRFYNHLGVDPLGIARAAWRNIQAGGIREGGSTITQQLAKLAFLDSDQTAGRKIQEALIALWLEAWLEKDEILSRYLSSVYFGDNVYGLRAAANHYFSRAPEDLTVEQAALLAGLLKAPSRLAPTDNLKGARERGKLVIQAMVEAGMLDEAEAAKLPQVKLKVGPVKDLPSGTYFADWAFPQARAFAEQTYGERMVETTLDDDLQRLAVQAIRRAPLGGAQVALVAMRPNGEVVAMVGGKSYKGSAFNRVTQARRQPGSAFKLFVYLAALRAGMTPDSMVQDAPITIGDWSPENNNDRYRGLITLRDAFAASSNVAAVRLQEAVGRQNVIEAARDLGVKSELTTQPSLALGTSGISLMELTAAYAAVAANEFPVVPRALPDEGEETWFTSLRDGYRRFSERNTRPMMLDLLHAAANEGTGRAAALRIDTFGKTGTTQDNRDAIFIGFAGDLVTGVWIGNDDNSPLRGVSGGGLPARIWRDFMSRAVDSPPAPRSAPARVAVPAEEPIETEVNAYPLPTISAEIGNEVAVEVDLEREAVTIRTPPAPEPQRQPAPSNIPVIAPPPPAPEEEPAPPDGE